MTMQVLLEKKQIRIARQELRNKGASTADSRIRSLMRRLGVIRGMAVGDLLKSWDVYSLINFIESNLNKDEPILDLGCYASELIVALHKLGYTNLTGADLNSNIAAMPHQNSINYENCDIMQTRFADCSFKAITSISVIEHGFNGPSLLKEMSRLLMPNGYFAASFDYWPEKVDTKGTKFFGMDWKIFSQDEISDFIALAADYGFSPVGKVSYASNDRVIKCAGKKYTFAFLILEKKTIS